MANKRLLIVLQEKQLKENNGMDSMMEGIPMDIPPMEEPIENPEPIVNNEEQPVENVSKEEFVENISEIEKVEENVKPKSPEQPDIPETGTMADILEPPMEETQEEPEYEYVDGNLEDGEYPNTYADHEVTPDELSKAIDTIISAFYQQKQNSITVDLDEREIENSMEEREMSLEEIEQALGCKVKIVNKVEWSDYGA